MHRPAALAATVTVLVTGTAPSPGGPATGDAASAGGRLGRSPAIARTPSRSGMAATFRDAPASAVVVWTPVARTRSGIRMVDVAMLNKGCSRLAG